MFEIVIVFSQESKVNRIVVAVQEIVRIAIDVKPDQDVPGNDQTDLHQKSVNGVHIVNDQETDLAVMVMSIVKDDPVVVVHLVPMQLEIVTIIVTGMFYSEMNQMQID